jgi:hypothetical protein
LGSINRRIVVQAHPEKKNKTKWSFEIHKQDCHLREKDSLGSKVKILKETEHEVSGKNKWEPDHLAQLGRAHCGWQTEEAEAARGLGTVCPPGEATGPKIICEELGMVAHTCESSILEAEARGL